MGIKCGIVGLPNVGKSTLFNALTASEIPAENYPFCTIDPNVGVVTVPDPKLDAIAAIVKPEKVVPTVVEFVDIAGLVEGASQGQGLGNQFLAHIRETHAIAHLVRCFENDDITHVSGKVDPLHDIEIIDTELMLADLETVQKILQRAERAAKANEKAAVARRDGLQKIARRRSRPANPRAAVALDEREADALARPAPDHREARDVRRERRRGLAARESARGAGAGARRSGKAPELVVISAALEAELAQLPERRARRVPHEPRAHGAGLEPRDPLGVPSARTEDVLHGGAEGVPRVDRARAMRRRRRPRARSTPTSSAASSGRR